MSRWQALAACAMLGLLGGAIACCVWWCPAGIVACVAGAYGALFIGVALEAEANRG